MNKIVKISISVLFVLYFVYAITPSPAYPQKTSESLQSKEPADREDINRRAYFTNMNREQIIKHYTDEFNAKFAINYKLNYPPEEAATLIRDQTRSTYLEEVVHPFRESLFINGFEPKLEKDAIFIEGESWHQKIIVKYNISSVFQRIVYGLVVFPIAYVLLLQLGSNTKMILKTLKRN